jgi:hypothetical protein
MLGDIYKDRKAGAKLDYLIGRWMERNGKSDADDIVEVMNYRGRASRDFERIWSGLPQEMRTTALAPAVMALSLGEVEKREREFAERKERNEARQGANGGKRRSVSFGERGRANVMELAM